MLKNIFGSIALCAFGACISASAALVERHFKVEAAQVFGDSLRKFCHSVLVAGDGRVEYHLVAGADVDVAEPSGAVGFFP